MLLLRWSGEFLLRLAERSLLGLLFQEPPRSTRAFRPLGRFCRPAGPASFGAVGVHRRA